jgi:UDP-N-acetyl-D-glucosamine dehydrogenase
MSQLQDRLKGNTAVIGIVGLGYVGLPLAVSFARSGLKVVGYDMKSEKVALIAQGESYIQDVSSKVIRELVASGLLEATNDISRFVQADVICICVPTPLTKTKEPDLSYVMQVANDICPYIRAEQLVVLESTTYPGTTRGVILPILERTGLRAGQDFYLVYSPERVDPGNKKYDIKNTPKLVGGIDERSTGLGELLYRRVAESVVPLSSPEAAEMTKLFENVFRIVNIALVNELAQLCEAMGISVWEVIGAAGSKPYGFMPFYPGLGVGGHCIPLDPYYLASKAKEYDFHIKFIELAVSINEQMPYYVTNRIMEAMNNEGKSIRDARVLVMGITYKKDVPDIRESPAIKLMELLHKKGARVFYNDPYVDRSRLNGMVVDSTLLNAESISSADCVVIATDHSCYDIQYIIDNARLVFDTRGITKGIKKGNIIRLGEYCTQTVSEEASVPTR